MSSKSKRRPTRDVTINKAVTNALAIFLYAFASEFSPEAEAFDRLRRSVASIRDSVICGALTIPEVKRALRDDYGWEVD